jgi:hypothetical protein
VGANGAVGRDGGGETADFVGGYGEGLEADAGLGDPRGLILAFLGLE